MDILVCKDLTYRVTLTGPRKKIKKIVNKHSLYVSRGKKYLMGEHKDLQEIEISVEVHVNEEQFRLLKISSL